MIFLWSDRNTEHIAVHGVDPMEAQEVVSAAKPPFPAAVGDEKHAVMGCSIRGRFLHVVFVYVAVDDVEADEYERLELYDKLALAEGEEAVRVIHARDLTEAEKRRLRRRT